VALQVIFGWHGLGPDQRGAALAFGNFDGVHKGHQQVIAAAAQVARDLGAPFAVSSFEPHPRRWFQPDAEPFRLMTLDQQARALDALGVDRFHVLPFDAEMANLTDEAFARQVLAEGLGIRHIAVGFDVTFGKGRTGDPATLARYGERFGFTVSVTDQIGDGATDKYSSTAVRDALQAGDPRRAAQILGRPFAIEGVVERGQQLGRTLGFPTANVAMGDYLVPRLGVYATRTRLPDGRILAGVANLGRNPTTGLVATRLEVFLFDFDEDIYGQLIETQLVEFLRPELTFDGLDPLVVQMNKDAATARSLLAAPSA
jgi:riboflavin kinase/FMN adenylyltransferase